jgi:probable rRNA maturation factor
MIHVYVTKQGSFGASIPKIKSALQKFLTSEGIVSDSDVSVTIVGEAKMLSLAKKYLKESNTLHNVLSFPSSEVKGEFKEPPDKILHLGEIVICYPKVTEEANEEGKMIDEKIIELCLHGALHLLGKHHE